MRRRLAVLALGACSLGACDLLLPYERSDDGGAATRDRGGDAPGDRATGEHVLVLLDGPPRDDSGDGPLRIPDAGEACETEAALWEETCRRTALENSCAIGCGDYTVVCIGNACDCAREGGDSHRCTEVTSSAANCEPLSACFEAVGTGCCVDL